jgi:hypothetical protein
LAAKLYESSNEPVYFWLDTLCCPTSPKRAKNLAIALMRKTYQQADKVVVLDSYLQSKPLHETSQIEAFMMIHNSPWNRRLWTLEECVLAGSRLLFQFDGGVLNPSNILIDTLADYLIWSNTTLSKSLLEGPAADCFDIGLRNAVPTDLDSLNKADVLVRDKLLIVQRALQDRQTSDPGDEAIYLAHLLNLEVKFILNTPKDKRMETFCSIHDIPSDLVFWMRGTLNTKGFRVVVTQHKGNVRYCRKVRHASINRHSMDRVKSHKHARLNEKIFRWTTLARDMVCSRQRGGH